MAFDFPSSPTIGQQFTPAEGPTYVYNGVGWASGAGAVVAAVVMPQGRLTLQSGTPVMTATQAAKTTIFYSPYVGNQIVLYNDTSMVPTTFSELSNLTTASSVGNAGPAAVAASSVYDLFVWSNAGTPTLTRGPAWTNDTTRSAGTALVRVNGIWLNAVAITNGPAIQRGTYVGTTRSNASSQLDWILGGDGSGGVAGFLGVWNAYNRRSVYASSKDDTDNWASADPAWHTPNSNVGSLAMRVSFVVGLQEDAFTASYSSNAICSTGSLARVGMGYDSIVANSVLTISAFTNATNYTGVYSTFGNIPLPGFHFVAGLEVGGTAGTTFFGDNGSSDFGNGLSALYQM